MALPNEIRDREYQKFVVDSNDKPVVRITKSVAGVSFYNSTTNETKTLKSGAGILHRVICSKVGGTLAIYDALSATNPIGTITMASGTIATLEFSLNFVTGLTIVGTTGGDFTIVYE